MILWSLAFGLAFYILNMGGSECHLLLVEDVAETKGPNDAKWMVMDAWAIINWKALQSHVVDVTSGGAMD